MNVKEFAEKLEDSGVVDYEGDDYEVRKRNRSPFDDVGSDIGEVYDWVKLKIECGATDLTKEEFNEWIIWDFENSGFFRNLTREKAKRKAKEGGYLL